MNLDRALGIVSRLRPGWRNRGCVNRSFSFANHSEPFRTHPASLSVSTGDLSHRRNAARGRKLTTYLQEWVALYLHSVMYLDGVSRDDFTVLCVALEGTSAAIAGSLCGITRALSHTNETLKMHYKNKWHSSSEMWLFCRTVGCLMT